MRSESLCAPPQPNASGEKWFWFIVVNLVLIGLSIAAGYFLTRFGLSFIPEPRAAFNSENKIIDPVAIPDSPLRTIVQQLSDKIDLLGLEDIKTKDQIKALRAADGVSREQTKYLTATVNKANFGS